MAKYLITGGAGFIGSNLAEELLKEKNEIRILDNFSSGKMENIVPFSKDIELIKGDIRNIEDVEEVVEGVDFVVHLAAVASVAKSVEDPEGTNKVNIDGTTNILKASSGSKVKKVIFASSCAVYGDIGREKARENMEPHPLSPYAKAKLKGEELCKEFSQKDGLPSVSLRLFNVFGPNQDPTSDYSAVIPKFITKMLKGEKTVIFGDGKQSRDFVYIGNVTKAIIAACNSDFMKGEVINIASGENHDLLELVKILKELLGTELDPVFEGAREGDIKFSKANINKALQMLKYEPSIDLKEGLERTIRYYKGTRI